MMQFRPVQSADYTQLIEVVDDWWGGRSVRHLMPRFFFEHFSTTSFCLEEAGQLLGFLLGFVSAAQAGVAYIHFIGVHPDCRQRGIGRQLYQHFFDLVQAQAVTTIKAITTPTNQQSIAFHKQLGFAQVTGDTNVDGVAIHSNYSGLGQHRVVFERHFPACDDAPEPG